MTEPEATTSGPPDVSPRGTPAVRWRWLFVGPLLALLLVAGGAAVVASSGDTSNGHVIDAAPPLELASVTDDVANHYRYAEGHQTELAGIPCFCGCEEFLGHENLYDCFIRTDGAGYESHAAGCGVCIGEAALASQLLDAGTPATEVAERIVEQFGTTPITSPAQTSPDPEPLRTSCRTSAPARPSSSDLPGGP